MTSSDPIAYLRRLHRAGNHNDVMQMIRDEDSVLARFGPLFSEPHSLEADDLVDFLHFEHNRHWWGLQRHADTLAARIDVVREVLAELLDDEVPLAERIDGIGPGAGLTPPLWSPMLLVARPERFGVWSEISESAMRRLGLWPEDDASEGVTYAAANDIMGAVADDLGIDLWTLDALWWAAEKEHDPSPYFVTRRAATSPRPRTRQSTPTAPSRARPRTPSVTEETFVCANCWTTKPVRLRSPGSDLCVDCA